MTGEPSQAEAVRNLLRDAAQHLIQSRDLLLGSHPDYAQGLTASVRVIRQALHAFILWHSLPYPEGTPLRRLARRAVSLASILETPIQQALPLETLDAALSKKASFTISEREAAQTSYYTARNTLYTVLNCLPASIRQAVQPITEFSEVAPPPTL